MPAKAINLLTARRVDALVLAGKPTAVSDGQGLTLTISSTGYAAWVLRYRTGGRRRELTIGPLTDISLADARGRAAAQRDLLRDGIDPAREKIRQQAARDAAGDEPETVAELFDAWMKTPGMATRERPELVVNPVRQWVLPRIGKMHIEDVRPGHLMALVNDCAAQGRISMPNNLRRYLRGMFAHAVTLDLIRVSPAANLTQDNAGVAEVARDRWLTLTEIRELLAALERQTDTVPRDKNICLRLLLLIGCRKGELIGAEWPEFDLDSPAPTWMIPGERIKTRRKGGSRDFTVPLPPQAVDWLRELETLACGSRFILPGRSPAKPMNQSSINLALGRLDLDMPRFRIHDLRRTMRSHLDRLGIDYAVAERCLNHRLPGVAGVYARHDLLDQRRDALTRWADVLTALEQDGIEAAEQVIGGAQVVQIQSRVSA